MSVLLASIMFYISIEKMPLDAPKHVILTLKMQIIIITIIMNWLVS